MRAADLRIEALCEVEIRLHDEAPISLGRSPWRNRRISYIESGQITGERLSGTVLPGGGDWAEGGQAADGSILTRIDVRSIWQTEDGARIYVTYGGRLKIPAEHVSTFSDLTKVETLGEEAVWFRVIMTFETADVRYDWINAAIGIGVGRRTRTGVRYSVGLST